MAVVANVAGAEAVVDRLQQDQQSRRDHPRPKIVAQCIKNTRNVPFTVLAPLVAHGHILNINQWTNEIASMNLI